MGLTKNDWLKAKKEYFDSDIIDVEPFLRQLLGVEAKKLVSRHCMEKAKGWKKEKEEYRKEIFKQETEIIANHPDVQDRVQNLIEAIQKVEKRVADLISLEHFTIDDLPKVKVGYDMLRLATGQSTQNTNIAGKNGGAIETDSIIRVIKL